MVRKKNILAYGWGINDLDRPITRSDSINGKNKVVWRCPYYVKWKSILTRCFCVKKQEAHPTYKDCTITDEWQRLSDFVKWVDSQPNRDWENCELDKDLLVKGNKHYSPHTAVFVSGKVNRFINSSCKTRGKHMLGVCSFNSKSSPYMSQCRNPFTDKQDYLGLFQTEIEAHKAWQSYKHKMACLLADEQPDERVAKILRERYAPDKDWTKA